MRFGSVCSGIEAASVAWASLGWKALGVRRDYPASEDNYTVLLFGGEHDRPRAEERRQRVGRVRGLRVYPQRHGSPLRVGSDVDGGKRSVAESPKFGGYRAGYVGFLRNGQSAPSYPR